ncbi:MAG: hypothetical protein EXQ47_03120 [Bryobacterales bacterium]|nr:hypothetical protein [Bryobacterales bacterium]
MSDTGNQDGAFFRGDAENHALETKANSVVVVSATQGLGQGERVFLHRFHCVQDLAAQAGWKLAERAVGCGQDLNGPSCGR